MGTAEVLRGKRVVVVNWRDLDHTLSGGSERYAWEWARTLVDAGARVDFLTARDRGQARAEARDGVHIVRRGGRWAYYLLAAVWLVLRRRRLDLVVDSEAGIPSFAPLFVPRRVPVLLVMHHVHLDQFALYFPGPLAALGRFLERRFMPRVYRRVTTVAVSESTRQAMRERLGWRGPIELLHNPCPAPAAPPAHPEDTTDRVVVLGRLSTHKRVDLVIRAVAALRSLRPALQLDIVGRGPDEARLAELVERLDVAKHVTLHGYVEEERKAELLARARLHVCASDWEGWGQVVLEAAACGVPTVARDVPGLRDSVRQESTGWLVGTPYDDRLTAQARLLVGLQSALEELDDPDRREEVSAACRAWAAGFSGEAMRDGARRLAVEALDRHEVAGT